MQKLFLDTRLLDSSCRFAYGLSEEVMMENAASALEAEIRSIIAPGGKVIILCGAGNNGADGYALSRRIRLEYEVKVYECYKPSSNLCILQASRAEKCGVPIISIEKFPMGELTSTAVVVDCIFGSGFHGDIEGENAVQIQCTLNDVNSLCCKKIACDVPTGIRSDGTVANAVFCADITVTMGAQKIFLYSDMAKDYVGTVKVRDLGVSRSLYENSNKDNLEAGYLLDESDMILPHRKKNLVNKGTFGSAYIACGEKTGASLIAANACFRFGAGLVHLISPDALFESSSIPGFTMDILIAREFGRKIDCVAVGMGLGRKKESEVSGFYFDYLMSNPEVKCVIDADLFYFPAIKNLIESRGKGCVLTPHPKEFSSLLKLCGIGDYSIDDCIEKRTELIKTFCCAFPDVVLLVKGANQMIGQYTKETGYKLYINNFGIPALAKGGSGDALAGMICALLTQGYTPLEAAKSASLAHSFAARKIKNDFALTPTALVDAIGEL